jgi:uncharacterized membrane protein
MLGSTGYGGDLPLPETAARIRHARCIGEVWVRPHHTQPRAAALTRGHAAMERAFACRKVMNADRSFWLPDVAKDVTRVAREMLTADERSMPNIQKDSVVAVFPSLDDAQRAVAQLEHLGWRPNQVSLVARGAESHLDSTQPMRQGDRMEKSAVVGASAGAALGLLAGSALFIVPGIGPVVFAGALASGITGGLVGGIVGAMSGWGIKEDHLKDYEQDVRDGKSVIIMTGSPRELADAKSLMQDFRAEKVTMHAETADSTVDR